MKGFKDFIMRGNLVELAVAFIMAAAFASVVKAFVTIVMDVIGKLGGSPNFSGYMPGGVHVGAFLTELIAFIILAAVVYFGLVKPYEAFQKRLGKGAEVDPGETEMSILAEIRDELRTQRRS